MFINTETNSFSGDVEHYVTVTVDNAETSVSVHVKQPTDETVHPYVTAIANALLGLSFAPTTVAGGFAAYLEERGWSVESYQL